MSHINDAIYAATIDGGVPPVVPPVITTAVLPLPLQYFVYAPQQIAATGGAPITFAIQAGALPAGVALSAGGMVTGTPSASGLFNFTVRATNAAGFDDQAYSWNIAAYLPSSQAASLKGWYRAGIGITHAGGNVTQWADQSGNGNNLVTDVGVPTFNLVDTISFVAAALRDPTLVLPQPIQISAKMRQDAWTAGQNAGLYGGNIAVGANTEITLYQPNGLGTPHLQLYAGAAGPQTTAGNQLPVGVMAAVTGLIAGAGSSLKINNQAEIGGNPGVQTITGFSLARNSNFHASVSFKEVILRNVNDAAIRAADHAYLMALP